MAAIVYLAMTAAEFAASRSQPEYIAWMACHFSIYGTGLCNLPPSLPAGSLLILNDRIPVCRHDRERIAGQLLETVARLECCSILLDFQTPDQPELMDIAACLCQSLPCPTVVCSAYAKDLDCPVFLPPCPHHTPLEEHISPWRGRDIWLDLAVDAETITLTREGSVTSPLPLGEVPEDGHCDRNLHCHYRAEVTENNARFTLWRTEEDLSALVQKAEALGIQNFVGLYQELQGTQYSV